MAKLPRYRNIQTVARFCALQKIHPQQAKYFLDLAMLNLKFGSKSLNPSPKVLLAI